MQLKMKYLASKITTLALVASLALATLIQSCNISYGKMNYPETKRGKKVDNYHGVEVADPYRWLENSSSKEVKDWVVEQNQFTDNYFKDCGLATNLKNSLKKVWYYDIYKNPFLAHYRLFYERNNILYIVDKSYKDQKKLVDPSNIKSDGSVSLVGYVVSCNGGLLAYGISRSGSDSKEWRIIDIGTKKELPDILVGVQNSQPAWSPDDKGFYYGRYDKPESGETANYFFKLYYHKIGTFQKEDKLVLESKENKERGFSPLTSIDGNYLVLNVWDGFNPYNRIYLKDLKNKNAGLIKLFDKADARYHYVTNKGSTFWFRTDHNAPKGRLISVDINDPKIKEVIPEKENKLEGTTQVGERFFCHYLKDACSQVLEYTTSGELIGEVKLPGVGSINGFWGNPIDTETYYTYESFNTPASIYKYDLKSQKSTLIYEPELNFDKEQIVTEQVFVPSSDNTRVPLFLTYKKGLKRNKNNPVFLYGYGGFGYVLGPLYSAPMIPWLEMGGVYAQACLRGGGEYGEDWHKAGMLENKKNTFEDVIACSNWMIENNYTSKGKIALAGRSNGGLTAAACMIKNPSLFGAVISNSGLFDMLRFTKYTIGWSWKSEYGSADDEKQFRNLLSYSPLHTLKDNTSYPATLLLTSVNDDRVVSFHSYKLCAALQNAQSGPAPILLRNESISSHGLKPVSDQIQEWTEKFCLLVRALDFEKPAEKNVLKFLHNSK